MSGEFRSGFVTLIGRPNVGKSSLVNALTGEKIAAVSSKPQMTRRAVRCILTTDDAQIVFVDTPGLHAPKHKLGEFMMREAESALEDVDAVCFVEEAYREPDSRTLESAAAVARVRAPKVLVLNKTDRAGDEEAFWRCVAPLQDALRPDAVVPVSARAGTNLDVLVEQISRLLPIGEAIYPEDMLADTTERFIAEEIIREKIFELTEQEVPHSVAVCVEELKSPDEYPELERASIRADIVVERPGQKGILIGDGGAMIKKIKTAARRELRDRFGWPVDLDLWIKVRPGWRKTERGIENLGYKRRR